MRADYNVISRTFKFTEAEVMIQRSTGECRRMTLQLRGILSDKQVLTEAGRVLNTEDQKVTFIIDRKFFRATFTQPIEKFFINSEISDREEIFLEAKGGQANG